MLCVLGGIAAVEKKQIEMFGNDTAQKGVMGTTRFNTPQNCFAFSRFEELVAKITGYNAIQNNVQITHFV